MIVINNFTTDPVDEKFLKKVAKIVLRGEKKKNVDLSIILIGEGKMKALNKKYRGKNRVTDVLAFGGGINLRIPRLKTQELGDVVICPREVKNNAKRYKSTFEKELTRVLIHGILHLLGYDHERDKNKADEMQKEEEYYLSKIKLES